MSSSDIRQAAAKKATTTAATKAHRDNIALEREAEAHRREDH